MIRIGVDLGGTKIEAIALDDAGRELVRRRIASPSHDYAQTIDAVRGLVDAIEGELGARGRGRRRHAGRDLGGHGPDQERQLDRSSTAGRSPSDLARALGREVRVENDANCFALSEASDGAGAGERLVFGVILGTGVGGGIVHDGRVWVGRERDRRRVGPQRDAVARRGGPARHALLLRAAPLHRDLPVRARDWPPTTGAQRAARRVGVARRRRDRRPRARRRRRRRARRWRASTSASPARWRR